MCLGRLKMGEAGALWFHKRWPQTLHLGYERKNREKWRETNQLKERETESGRQKETWRESRLWFTFGGPWDVPISFHETFLNFTCERISVPCNQMIADYNHRPGIRFLANIKAVSFSRISLWTLDFLASSFLLPLKLSSHYYHPLASVLHHTGPYCNHTVLLLLKHHCLVPPPSCARLWTP